MGATNVSKQAKEDMSGAAQFCRDFGGIPEILAAPLPAALMKGLATANRQGAFIVDDFVIKALPFDAPPPYHLFELRYPTSESVKEHFIGAICQVSGRYSPVVWSPDLQTMLEKMPKAV